MLLFSPFSGLPRPFTGQMRSVATVCGVAILIVATGCSSVTIPKTAFSKRNEDPTGAMENGYELDPNSAEKVYQAVRVARSKNQVVLQVVGEHSKILNLPLPDDDRGIYVSQLLKETGVMKKLGGVNATLFRHSADSIGGIRMEVKTSKDHRTIRPESDYALQAGDRLRVTKASFSPLNQLFDATGLN